MIQNNEKKLSKVEELITFYNKYLALDNDDRLLMMLVNNLSDLFIKKVHKYGDAIYQSDLEKDLEIVKYTQEDKNSLTKFEQSCMKFHEFASIKYEDNIAYIDKFGTIIDLENPTQDSSYIGKDIFELLQEKKDNKAIRDAQNVILQNILVSKLYQAIYEKISVSPYLKERAIFVIANDNFLSYEHDLAKKNKKSNEIINAYPKVRSRR